MPNNLLRVNVSKVFDKLGVHAEGKDIQVCQTLKNNDRAVLKFSNRKDSLQILRVMTFLRGQKSL